MRFTRKNLALFILATILIAGSFGHIVHADPSGAAGQPTGTTPSVIGGLASLFGVQNGLFGFMAQGITTAFYSFQTMASWILILAGKLLNYSMNLTLHINDFVQQTPAIYQTWTALRDIIGLFFIFFLLYAAIKLIIGQDSKLGSLIKSLVIAGVLVNFSFFFAGLGIDASNVVSMQLYNAIAPSNSLGTNLQPTGIWGNSGGIADIFMSSLKVPALYNVSGQTTPAGAALTSGAPWTDPVKMLLIEVTSIIIMITAAISFTLASAAFVVRFVLLIFLLAFSPIMFAAFIAPEVAAKTKKWFSYYKNMLLFMPVYLLLMYLALNVLTTVGPLGTNSGLAAIATAGVASSTAAAGASAPASGTAAPTNTSAPSATPDYNIDDSAVSSVYAQAAPTANASAVTATWYASFVSLAINAVIVIFLLNLPLVAAIEIGGVATDWIDAKKWGAQGVWGYVGAKTVGEGARRADKYLENTTLGNSAIGRKIRSGTTGALAKSQFGGKWDSAVDRDKVAKDIAKKQGEIDRRTTFDKQLKQIRDGSGKIIVPRSGLGQHPEFKATIGKMTKDEKLALGVDGLKNPNVLRYLGKKDFESIKDSDKFTEEQKKEIFTARDETFKTAVVNGDKETVKDMIKNYDATDLMGMKAEQGDLLSSPTLVQALTQGQLKTMSDAGLSVETKQAIGDAIMAWPQTHEGKYHPAFPFIKKNGVEWTSGGTRKESEAEHVYTAEEVRRNLGV